MADTNVITVELQSIALLATMVYDEEHDEWTASNDVLRVAAAGRTEEEARAGFIAALLELQMALSEPAPAPAAPARHHSRRREPSLV